MRLALLAWAGCAGEGYDVFVPAPLEDYSWSGPGLERVDDDACSVPSDATPFASSSHVLLENRLAEALEVVHVSSTCTAEPLADAPPQETTDLSLLGGDVIQVWRVGGALHSTWQVSATGLAGGGAPLVIQ